MSLLFLLQSEAYMIFWKGVLRNIRAINKYGEIGTRERLANFTSHADCFV